MRGAYYVATALLIMTSSRTAAKSGQPMRRQIFDYDVMVADNDVVTTRPHRFLRGSRDLTTAAADEQRAGDFSLPNISDIIMKVSAKIALPDDAKGVVVFVTTLINASEKAQSELQLNTAGHTTASRLTNEWMELAKKIHLKPPESIESPVIPVGTHAAGQINTSRKQEHLASTRRVRGKRKRGPERQFISPAKAQPEEQINPPSDIATKFDVHFDHLGKISLKLSPRVWARYINLDATSSTPIEYRVLPPGRFRNNVTTRILQQHTESKLKATYNKFVKLCSPSYKPTKLETASLLSRMKWQRRDHARGSLRDKAKADVVDGMLILMKDDKIWGWWVHLTESQKIEILNNMLNVHYQRWVWMYKTFTIEKPDISKAVTSPEPAMNEKPGMGTQPSSSNNIGKSSDFASPQHVKSHNFHFVEPTSTDLTTRDFLIDFDKTTQPIPDDNIGKHSDQSPSLHLTLGVS